MYFPLARIVHMHAYYMCCTFNPMLCTTLFSIKARAQFKSAFAIFNSTILQRHQVNYSTSQCAVHSVITNTYITHFPSLTTFISLLSGQVDSGILERVTYLGPCTLPDLDLTSSMSERKKSQAGASIPPTPKGEEDHAHSLGTH